MSRSALPAALILFLGTLPAEGGGLPSPGRADLPQEVLAEVLKKQSETSFEGERVWTYFLTERGKDSTSRQKVTHRPPTAYRVDYLGQPEGEERHVILSGDRLLDWDEDMKVRVRERDEDDALGLLLTLDYLERLEENYEIRTDRGPKVAGRATYSVRAIPRYKGRPAVQVWVDREWGVPLKMERYDYLGRLGIRMEYSRISFGGEFPDPLFEAPEDAEIREGRPSPVYRSPEELYAAEGQPVPLATVLPQGFRFVEARTTRYNRNPAVQSFYTDGYADFSLFVIDQSDPPPGAEQPGIRGLKSVRRGTSNWVMGWLGEDRLAIVSYRLAAAELARILLSVVLERSLPDVTFYEGLPPM
ncbi:MAG: sigma-E factor regulatory protein RseB domain-containing protein [bacterium]